MDEVWLTDLEMAILQLLAEGRPRSWIEDRLGISRATLYRQLEGIRQKLQAESNSHAVVIALERGLIGSGSRAGEGKPKPQSTARLPWRYLTRREWEVFMLLGDVETSQQTDRQLAQQLHIAEGTLKKHLHHIYQKLGVANRSSAALLASQAKRETGKQGDREVGRRRGKARRINETPAQFRSSV
jgi:DNA-binding CsgD family transcriptional regulator